MKIILLDNIDNLGKLGSEIKVKSGYARNFLIPQSKAIVATTKNIAIFKEQQRKLKVEVLKKWNEAKICAEKINMLQHVTITAKSGISGKLFGSIGSRDIADTITKASGVKIFKSQIRLPNNDVLKTIGTYSIKIHIYNDIFAMLDIIIVDMLSLK